MSFPKFIPPSYKDSFRPLTLKMLLFACPPHYVIRHKDDIDSKTPPPPNSPNTTERPMRRSDIEWDSWKKKKNHSLDQAKATFENNKDVMKQIRAFGMFHNAVMNMPNRTEDMPNISMFIKLSEKEIRKSN